MGDVGAGEAGGVEGSGRPVDSPGGSSRPYWRLFLSLAGVVVLADQATKAWVLAAYQPDTLVPLLGEYIRIALSHNNGGLFGLFRGQALVFAGFSLGVIALIVEYHRRAGRSRLLSTALGLLLGGALGNLVDRIRFGYVNDFVDMGIGSWRWYTYNLADAAISCSLLLFVLLMIWPDRAGGRR